MRWPARDYNKVDESTNERTQRIYLGTRKTTIDASPLLPYPALLAVLVNPVPTQLKMYDSAAGAFAAAADPISKSSSSSPAVAEGKAATTGLILNVVPKNAFRSRMCSILQGDKHRQHTQGDESKPREERRTHKKASNGPPIITLPTSSPPSTNSVLTNHSHPRSTHPPLRISSSNNRATCTPRSSGTGGVQRGVTAFVPEDDAEGEGVGAGQEEASAEWRTWEVEEATRVMA